MAASLPHQIINIIRQRRNELGYTQNYLAGKLDMSQNSYSDLELGYKSLNIDRLLAVCKALNLSPVHLLNGQTQKPVDFSKLFYSSESPLWQFDPVTLRFLEINNAAMHHYGFSRADFMQMTIKEIRPKEDGDVLHAYLKDLKGDKTYDQPVRHWHRDGTIKNVRITCYQVETEGIISYLVHPQAITISAPAIAQGHGTNDHFTELRVLAAQLETGVSAAHTAVLVERMQTLLGKITSEG